jgi:AraC-like DNA-binding protein
VVEPVNEAALGHPTDALSLFIEGYRGYQMTGYSPGIHRGLPGRHLTFIVSLGGPVDIAAMPDRRHPPVAFDAFVSGYHFGPAAIAHDGNQYGIGLDLTPAGARALLGLPAAALAGIVVHLEDVFGRDAERLVDRLASTPLWMDRFAVLDEVLLRALAARRKLTMPRPEVTRAWDQLVASRGQVDVSSLAAEVGWSRRHLAEQFRSEIGLPPKTLARVLRFERSKELLKRADRPSLVDVAAVAGYYDQAHLNRDWRDLAGCSPTVWMAEEQLTVDAGAAADVDAEAGELAPA